MEQETKTVHLTYKAPRLMRVFSAHLFDFFASFFLAVFLFSLNVLVLHRLPLYQGFKTEQTEIQVRSGLYVEQDKDTKLIVDLYRNDNTLTTKEKSEKISSSLEYFFDVFLKEKTKIEDPDQVYDRILLSYKDEDGMDLFDSKRKEIQAGPDEEKTYLDAYCGIVSKYALGYLSYVDGYSASRQNIILSYAITFLLSLSFSLMILYLMVPLCFGRGRKTFGIAMNRMGYVALDGFSPSKIRCLLRFLFQWILIFLASFFTLGIPLFVSVGFIFLSKNHQTLSDYVSGVVLIDQEDTKIFMDYYDYASSQIIDDAIDGKENVKEV